MPTAVSLCKHCDHFVEENDSGQDRESYSDTQDRESYAVAAFVHLCDGQHHTPDDHHEAEPRGEPKPLETWKAERPDLFVTHPDGLIGPNSRHHRTQLDPKPEWEK